MRTISIVTPCYNEELNVAHCHAAIRALFADKLPDYAYEHVFCDNASQDRTPEILREIAAADPNVKVILNARNFGANRSCFNGVMATTGDAVVLCMPVDLQDPPELLPQFVALWKQGYEVVYGIRQTREEGRVMRSMRGLYYRVLTGLSELAVPQGTGDYQLVDRKVVEAMRQIDDSSPFMRMMTFECGFRSVGIPYRWAKRQRGVSKNSLIALVDQGLNGLVTFTNAPLRLAMFAGFGIATLAILYSFASLVSGLVFYRELAAPGIMTLITAVFFFGGVQLFALGVLAEYILAIYGQVRSKPIVFERERMNFDNLAGAAAAMRAADAGRPGEAGSTRTAA